MEKEPSALRVGVGVDMVDAAGVEGAGAADKAVDLVALGEEQFCEVASVLAGDAGDQCALHGDLFFVIGEKP